MGDLLVDSQAFVVDGKLAADETVKTLRSMLGTLSEQERTVLELTSGMATGKVETLKKVGERFGVSHQYISKIRRQALAKLRNHPLSSQLIEDSDS